MKNTKQIVIGNNNFIFDVNKLTKYDGYILTTSIKAKWFEDFVDEDTGEVVTIERWNNILPPFFDVDEVRSILKKSTYDFKGLKTLTFVKYDEILYPITKDTKLRRFFCDLGWYPELVVFDKEYLRVNYGLKFNQITPIMDYLEISYRIDKKTMYVD